MLFSRDPFSDQDIGGIETALSQPIYSLCRCTRSPPKTQQSSVRRLPATGVLCSKRPQLNSPCGTEPDIPIYTFFLHRPVVASERVPSFGVAIASKVSTYNTRPAIRCCPMTNVTLPVQPARPMSSVRLTTSAASRCSTLLLFWLHLLSSADCLPRRPIYPDEDMQRVLFTCMWC